MEDLFDRYVTGKLDPAERLEVENRSQNDPAFAEAFRKHVQAVYIAREYAHQNRFNTFNREFDRLSEERIQRGRLVSLRPVMLGIAAALVLIMGFAWIFSTRNSSSEPQALYAAYTEVYPLSNRRDLTTPKWSHFSEAYAKGEYSAAINLAETLLADSADSRLYLYLGISQMMSDRDTEALQSFEKVERSSSFIEPAEWYTVMVMLKQGQTDAAIPLLESMAASSHYKRAQATEILAKLSR